MRWAVAADHSTTLDEGFTGCGLKREGQAVGNVLFAGGICEFSSRSEACGRSEELSGFID